MIFAGPDLKVFLWTAFMFGIYLLFSLIGASLKKRLFKVVIIGVIVVIVTFGLTAVKVLPVKEYLESTERLDLPYEQSASRKVAVGDLFFKLVEPLNEFPQLHKTGGTTYQIGLVGFALVLFALFNQYKKRMTAYLGFLMVLSLFLVTGSFVFYLLWKYAPLLTGFRYLPRTLVIFAFSGSVLAGIGVPYAISWAEKKTGLGAKKIFLIIIALIVLNLLVLGPC